MIIEIDQSLRVWNVRDSDNPVAVVNGKAVHKVSFTYKTLAAINEYMRKNGGFAQIFQEASNGRIF